MRACVCDGGSGLNDDQWHYVIVVVDELTFRVSAAVDTVHHKSSPLRRCVAASQTDHAQPVPITLAGSRACYGEDLLVSEC